MQQRATQTTKVIVNIGSKRGKKTRQRRRVRPAGLAPLPPSAPMPIREIYFMSELGRTQPVQGSIPQASKELSAPKVEQPESDPFLPAVTSTGVANELTTPRRTPSNPADRDPSYSPTSDARRLPAGDPLRVSAARQFSPLRRGERIQCPKCNQTYMSKVWFEKHLKQKHPE